MPFLYGVLHFLNSPCIVWNVYEIGQSRWLGDYPSLIMSLSTIHNLIGHL